MPNEAKEVMKQMNEAIVKPLHTPLPWTVGRFSLGSPNEPISKTSIIGSGNIDGNRDIIAEVHMNHEACDTNAELIVRALERCYERLLHSPHSRTGVDGVTEHNPNDCTRCIVGTALKKARG